MPKRVILYPYRLYSASAKAIQKALQEQGITCIRVRQDGNYKPRNNDLIINWGNSHNPIWIDKLVDIMGPMADGVWLNRLWSTTQATNKLNTFNILKEAGVSIPEYTTDIQTAIKWQYTDKINVIGRHLLTGHSGDGIVLFEPESEFNPEDDPCRLYVKYIKKKAEYRVHIFKGEVIDIQEKRKIRNYQGRFDSKIRSHQNGWVYCRERINTHDSIRGEAIKSIEALGLDFGAVDVVWNNKQQKAYVLEVNTAPGLEGTTLTNYVNKIKGLL